MNDGPPCHLCHATWDDEASCCYACKKYHNIDTTICYKCSEEDKTEDVYASRFFDLLEMQVAIIENYAFCKQSCRAKFNIREIMYPRVFAIGKIALYLKRTKQRKWWAETSFIMLNASRYNTLHPVWLFLYQQRSDLIQHMF